MSTVPVSFYVDYYCNHASSLNPSANIPLNTCILTPGAKGLIGGDAPCSDGSNLRYAVFYRSACGGDYFNEEGRYCSEFNNNFVPGFVAYCGDFSQVQISSTSTILVASTVGSTPSSTASSATTASAGGQTSRPSSSPTPTPSTQAPSDSSKSFPIAAIVVIAVVGAIVLLALLLCCCCWKNLKAYWQKLFNKQPQRSHVGANAYAYQPTVGGSYVASSMPPAPPSQTFSQMSTNAPSLANQSNRSFYPQSPPPPPPMSYVNPRWNNPLTPEDSASNLGTR